MESSPPAWFPALRDALGLRETWERTGELFIESRRDARVEFANGALRRTIETAAAGAAVRTVDGRAAHASADPPTGLGLEVPAPDIDRIRARIDTLLRSAAGRVEATVHGTWVTSEQRVWVGSPDRVPATDRRRGARLRVTAHVERGSRIARATGDRIATRRAAGNADVRPWLGALVARATRRLDAEAAQTGALTAVFAPGVGGVVIHELVGHALEADEADADRSAWSAAGRRFGRDDVRVIDDPRRGRIPWQVDDEGTPARAVGLIDRGRRAGWLAGRTHAGTVGTSSTGHARRASYLDPVRPRMGCTFLAASRDEADDAVRATRRGVYVRRLEVASTDVAAGIAWFRVDDADRIERGRVTVPLTPFHLEVTLDGLLDGLTHIGNDLTFDPCVASCVKGGQPLAASVGSPTIRVEVVRVRAGEE